MKNKRYYYLQIVCSTLWLIYFIYALGTTVCDIITVKKIEWEQAENISSTYSNYKGTLVTYSYQKGKVKIARTYGGLTQGLTVWSWGIDKKAKNVNISFYVKEKDYNKVINNSPSYHNLWFSDIKKVDNIPFFGLRKMNDKPNKIILFFDLLKYNYFLSLGLLIFYFPILLIVFFEKKDFNTDFLINGRYLSIIHFIFVIMLLSRFLI